MDREALGQATHLLPWVLEHSVRHPIGHTIANVWKTFSTFCTDPLNKIPIDWTLPPFHRKAKTALRGSWMIPPWTIKSNWEVFILKPGECSSDARGLSCCPEGLNMVDIKSLMETCLKVGNQNDVVWKWWSEFTSSSHLLCAVQDDVTSKAEKLWRVPLNKEILKRYKMHTVGIDTCIA